METSVCLYEVFHKFSEICNGVGTYFCFIVFEICYKVTGHFVFKLLDEIICIGDVRYKNRGILAGKAVCSLGFSLRYGKRLVSGEVTPSGNPINLLLVLQLYILGSNDSSELFFSGLFFLCSLGSTKSLSDLFRVEFPDDDVDDDCSLCSEPDVKIASMLPSAEDRFCVA